MMMARPLGLGVSAAAFVLLASAAAAAQAARYFPTHEADRESARPERRDVRKDLPIAAYAYSAQGARQGTAGGQAFMLGLIARGQSSTLGGGASVWGAPLERLTLVGDAQKNIYGNFSPSIAAIVPLLGERHHGWSLGGLGKFKVDGFASGPQKDEIESELELGALISFAETGFGLDLNVIGGRGLGDDGETDTEMRLRVGHTLGELVRLGLDAQGRLRLSGPRALPNGRTWDFAAGPQLLVGSGSFFAVLTAGPATTGLLSRDIGFTSVLGIGGTT
jgi:hypothetical protein